MDSTKLHIAAVVPNLDKRGGVRRFLELGNELVALGHQYTIFTEAGCKENFNWFPFKGEIKNWQIDEIKADYILIGDPQLLPVTDKMKGKIFVIVIAGGPYKEMYRQYYLHFEFIVNNGMFLVDYPFAHVWEFGVNTNHFKPKHRKVLFYGGDGAPQHKQRDIILKELSDVPGIELIELKNLNNDELIRAYHDADYFVSWELPGGWSNTSAEAIACGIPVVSNGNNCEPFFNRVIIVDSLRDFFSSPMKEFGWERAAEKLITILKESKHE